MGTTQRQVARQEPLEFSLLARCLGERSHQPMIAVEGPTHVVRYANSAFCRLLGCEAADLVDLPIAEAVPAGTANGSVAMLDRVFESGEPEELSEQEHAPGSGPGQPGSTRCWTYWAWPILGPKDEAPVGVMIQVTDATEAAIYRRKSAAINEALLQSGVRQHELVEASKLLSVHLRESEARLAGLKEAFESAVHGASLGTSLEILVHTAVAQTDGDPRAAFFVVDPNGECLHSVPGASTMPDTYLRAVEGFAIAANSPSCGLAAHSARPVIVSDVTLDPLWRPWLSVAQEHDIRACWSFPIQTRASEVMGTFEMYFATPREVAPRDVDLVETLTQAAAIIISRNNEAQERERVEEALLRSEANERESRVEAQEANRSKDIFLATLSHELRSPLNAILGWTVLLRTAGVIGKPLDKNVAEGLAVIERNARGQAKIIEEVLDVARITSGKFVLDSRPMDVTALVFAAVDAVRPSADNKGLVIVARRIGVPGRLWVMGDDSRLQQVISNLLTNAIKFTPKGGHVTVCVERIPGSHADRVRVTVSDTGKGIDPAVLPFLFERFMQGGVGTTRHYGGLGLGLSIVRHIVEAHGGTASAESEGEGRGSTFAIELPLIPEPLVLHQETNPDIHPAQRLDGLLVLVVDNEEDARTLAVRALDSAGAKVIQAESAEAGYRLAVESEAQPHVLVIDIGMPEEDGYSMMRRLRAKKRASEMPAVAMSAFAAPEDKDRMLRGGFQVHLAKPVDPNDLIAAVAGLTGRANG